MKVDLALLDVSLGSIPFIFLTGNPALLPLRAVGKGHPNATERSRGS